MHRGQYLPFDASPSAVTLPAQPASQSECLARGPVARCGHPAITPGRPAGPGRPAESTDSVTCNRPPSRAVRRPPGASEPSLEPSPSPSSSSGRARLLGAGPVGPVMRLGLIAWRRVPVDRHAGRAARRGGRARSPPSRLAAGFVRGAMIPVRVTVPTVHRRAGCATVSESVARPVQA